MERQTTALGGGTALQAPNILQREEVGDGSRQQLSTKFLKINVQIRSAVSLHIC